MPGWLKSKAAYIFLTVIIIAGLILGVSLLNAYIAGMNEADRLKALHEEVSTNITPQVKPSETPRETPGTTPRETPGAPAVNAPSGTATPAVVLPEKEPDAKVKTVLPEYSKLLEINNEVVGWIKLEGTRIDYPLLHHSDNEYYLHHSIEGKTSKRGCVYVDYRNNTELLDRNTLIYAHNMKDGSMFKALVSYKKEDYFNANRKININTLYEKGVWEVFSVYVVNADRETIDINYSKKGSFLKALESYKKRSKFKTDTGLSENDKIVTLVTCSYETSNSRTIVHAKYVGKGD